MKVEWLKHEIVFQVQKPSKLSQKNKLFSP